MIKNEDVPAWVDPFFRKVEQALRLEDWTVTIRMTDLPQGEVMRTQGQTTAYVKYLEALIELSGETVGAEPTEKAKLLIVHEMLHIALQRQQRAVELCDHILTKRQRKTLWAHYEDAMEETITRISRALLPLIEAMPDAPEA